MTIFTTQETLDNAVDTFYLARKGRPKLIPLGLGPVDRELGGLGPGACGVLAAATGVGKSSTMLAAMLNSKVKVGSVSLEDTPDVVGSRILSALSGVDSMRIRRKDLSKEDLLHLNKVASNREDLDNMLFAYPTAGSIEQVEAAITELCDAGCKMIWVDYLQEIRGHGHGDRRNEVSEAMTRCHRAAGLGNAALMMVSQFRRLGNEETVPQIYHLKESGDIENKARIIILAHKKRDPEGKARVRFRVGKSTYGGENVRFDMCRDASGTLREVEYLNNTDGDW